MTEAIDMQALPQDVDNYVNTLERDECLGVLNQLRQFSLDNPETVTSQHARLGILLARKVRAMREAKQGRVTKASKANAVIAQAPQATASLSDLFGKP